MNGKGIRKEYDINDFSFGQVAIISKPYEQYSEELGIDTMMHGLSEREHTLLLHEGNKITDLKNSNRKFYIPRDGEEKSSVIEYEYPLGEYCQAAGLPISTCTPKEALKIVKKYAYFFAYYTSILRANEMLKEETKREIVL